MATAAIAFIGWTAIGISKISPVTMLKMPAKNRADVKSRPFVTLMPTSSGINVPRSPSEPEISFRLNMARIELRTRLSGGSAFISRGISRMMSLEIYIV